MRDSIVKELMIKFSEFGTSLGFSKPIVRSCCNISEMYIVKNHAIQIEIDWNEYDLYMYVVYLREQQLPSINVVYKYDDGHWCRRYLEDLYQVKRNYCNDRNKRYSSGYLFERFDYYINLVNSNCAVLMDFLQSIDDLHG